MKNKRLETVLYSAGGVAVLLVVLIAANFIGTKAKFRLDFTADKSFTLSEGTRAILRKLDTPVQVRLYVSQKEKAMPVVLKDYATRVQDLLDEYRQASGGKVQITKLDPEPDSDAEDSARLDGLDPQMLQTGDAIYFGLAMNMLDQKVVVPLALERERLLEYDLSRAISLVMNPTKPVIGVMSSLPIFGGSDPMMAMRGAPQQEPAIFLSELKQAFDVKQVEVSAATIDDDINLLLLVHAKDLTEETEYAIDQFILRGGKLIAFLDPSPVFDKSQAQQNPMFGNMPGGKSSLDRLLPAWGLAMEGGKVVADMTYKTVNQGGDQPTVIRLTADAMNKDDVVTSQIDDLVMLLAGAITGKPVDGLTETVLVKSSPQSQLVDGFMAAMGGGENVLKDFKPSGVDYALAVQLSGKFKTAFPNGKPGASADTNAPAASGDSLKESKADTQVILVADSDMLNDQIVASVQNFFGQKIITPRFGNLTFVQSLVEKLSGDSNLISVRSRATINRPFTLVQKMEAAAQEEYRGKIKTLMDSQQEIERKLSELLQSKGAPGQQIILPPEQQKEIENFKKQQVETSKQLKQIRKEFRQDIDALQNRLKAINLLAMPAAVALCGVAIAVFKRKRTAAK
jgi:ABC-type uncharacterized transport system involved in gliding motility auxiliary subunit